MPDMSIKDALRVHLARHCAEEELCSWYDPLRIHIDPQEGCLTVTLPHHLFGHWFAKTGQSALESCLAPCLGKSMPIRYLFQQQYDPTAAVSSAFPTKIRVEKPFGENFTLENFIVNKKNFFPLALAHEITKAQKKSNYNPLVYYGKSGCGKTHLLRAIGNQLSTVYDYPAVFWGSMSKLIQEREQHGSDSGKYQAYCVDDIHLSADDFPLQEKFTVFLDACIHEKKQFVCTCFGSLASHKGFSESLRSRLELGIIVALKNPDIDVRMRFVQSQCSLHGIHIAQEDMLLLAQRCEHLRHLSGVLLKIVAYKKHTQQEISWQSIEKILQLSGEHNPITPQDIIRRVAEYFSLSPEEITSNKRKSTLVFARQAAMYLCREILGTSYPVLGQIFGGKDHSTVIYSIRKIEEYIVMNKNAHTEITKLKSLCLKRND